MIEALIEAILLFFNDFNFTNNKSFKRVIKKSKNITKNDIYNIYLTYGLSQNANQEFINIIEEIKSKIKSNEKNYQTIYVNIKNIPYTYDVINLLANFYQKYNFNELLELLKNEDKLKEDQNLRELVKLISSNKKILEYTKTNNNTQIY